MKKYIKREDAINLLWLYADESCASVVSDFENLPAADVAPVRYGRWVPADQFGDCCYTCSECGFERDAYLLDVGNYCPACGARMSGKEDNT